MSAGLSSISDIQNNVQFSDGGFSFVDTAGGMIGNREFEAGFEQFKDKRDNSAAYIWNVISAVGDELGDVLYTNIRNYIQKVSDVETCTVNQLKSLMEMLGFEYTIYEQFDTYPTELLDLINVLTINKKYLMSDSFLKSTLVSSLYCDGRDQFGQYSSVISGNRTGLDQYLSGVDPSGEEYRNLSAFRGMEFTVDSRTFRGDSQLSSDGFMRFVKHLYSNLLLGFLTLRHGDSYAISSVVSEDENKNNILFINNESRTEIAGDHRQYKIQYGIDPSFDENGIADDINDGIDSIDNYDGQKKTLLELVIKEREQRYKGCQLNTSRYAYYRTRKVKQYQDFILNKYYQIQLNSNGVSPYKLDSNYYQLSASDTALKLFDISKVPSGQSIDELSPAQLLSCGVINNAIFSAVIENLQLVTQYIVRLREKIKLQTRKNYMKGTNNLLLYVINEYLLDYSRNAKDLSVQQYFREYAPSIDDLKVIEYYDQTEYYNIETDYDGISISSGQTVNPKFWRGNLDKSPQSLSKYNSLALNQIQDFYLSAMNLKSVYMSVSATVSSETDYMNDFLDTVYGCGSVRDSINEIGFLNTQLTRGGEWTKEMYDHLVRLSSNYQAFNQWLSSGDYEYDITTPVSAQISDVTENYIFVMLSDQYLSAVSSVYDQFIVSVDTISGDLDKLDQDYYDILSGDMSFYFEKPDQAVYPDCYDEDGNYKHDWYTGNEQWDNGLKYVYDKYSMLYTYCETSGNVVNHPLIDTCEAISAELRGLSAEHYSDVVSELSAYGYIDVNAEYFSDELQSTYDFCNSKITERTTYLTDLLNSLKTEAQSLRSSYDQQKQQLPNIIAQYKQSAGLSSLWYCPFAVGKKVCGAKMTGDDYQCPYEPDTTVNALAKGKSSKKKPDGTTWYTTYYNSNTGLYYYKPENEDGDRLPGDYNYEGSLDDSEEIDILSSDIETLAKNLLDFLNQMTSVEYVIEQYTAEDDHGDEQKFTICKLSKINRGMNDIGVASAISQAVTDINNLENSVANLQNTIKDLFGLEDTTVIRASTVYDTISAIITFLNDHGFEIVSKDTLLKYFRSMLAKINGMISQYKVIEDRYQNDILGNSKQAAYLQDANVGMDLTYKNLDKILKFAEQKDATNRKSLLDQVQGKIDEYIALQETLNDVAEQMSQYETLPSQYVIGGLMLEDELANLQDFLINDVYLKTTRQNVIIDGIKKLILGYLDVIEDEISEYLGEFLSFDDAVASRLDDVNFYDKDGYIRQKELFLEYGGQKFCYYPYYNFKNIEHPSYQIHPFLWNFIAADSYTDRLVKQFYNVNIEDFEADRIKNAISSYVGEFGNVIDAWKHQTLDFSGYTTRYENSSHLYNQIWSEAVDFDGSFHPNAISDLTQHYSECLRSMRLKQYGNIATKAQFMDTVRTALGHKPMSAYTTAELVGIVNGTLSGAAVVEGNLSASISACLALSGSENDMLGVIGSCVSETFYGRYYDHLQLTRHDIGLDADRIDEYWPYISAIASDRDASCIYDIYRYGRDINGNALILFKVYNDANPTYAVKKNTLGDMWVRCNNRPLAFPAFWGRHSNICMNDVKYFFPSILRLQKAQAMADDLSAQLSAGLLSCAYFYDFCQSNNGYYIGLVTYPTDKGKLSASSTETISAEQFNAGETLCANYENAMILNGYSETIIDESGNRTNIYYSSETALDRIDYIWSGNGVGERPHLSSAGMLSDVNDFAYIGNYVKDSQCVYHVYADKVYLSSGGSVLSNAIRAYWLDGTVLRGVSDTNAIITDPVGSEVCFSYDSSKNALTFAYMQSADTGSYDYSGSTFEYENDCDMNSNDRFETNVRIVRAVNSGKAFTVGENNGYALNTHADMSYIPAHASKVVATDVVDQRLTNRYRSIELLGRSKDITDIIDKVNVSADPYMDASSLSSSKFGIVYEDYDDTIDNTFSVYKNPLIKNSLCAEDKIEWVQKIGQESAVYDSLQVAVYNVNSLGCSPYYIGRLDKLSSTKRLAYDEPAQEEQRLSDIDYIMTVTGLQLSGQTKAGSNRINGISSIDMQVLTGVNGLSSIVSFNLDSTEKPSQYAHISEGDIRIAVFDPNKLDAFEKYHLLDAYGIVYALSASQLIATEYIYGNGWTIVSNPIDKDFRDELIDFYDDRYGRRKKFKDIDVSRYSQLSDIWLMNTCHRLQFKYQEEALFELSSGNYYFPSINCKYPKTLGQLAEDEIRKFNSKIRCMADYFGNNEIYVIRAVDAEKAVENIGVIDVPIINYPADKRVVFEDYLSSTEVDLARICNYDKYDVNDEEGMSEYYHCFEDMTDAEYAPGTDETYVKADEGYVSRVAQNKVTVTLSSGMADLEDYTKIYVNYRKTANKTIELFFNYFNYIKSPFVEIRQDGNVYQFVQPGSYLRLDSGEDGILDICVQVKYYEGAALVGYKMLKLASYHVYNVSDDRPKFMLDRIYETVPGDHMLAETPKVAISIHDLTINMNSLGQYEYGESEMQITIESTDNLQYPYSFYVEYPQALICSYPATVNRGTYCYEVEQTRLKVNILEQTSSVRIPVRTANVKHQMEDYFNQEYPSYIAEYSVAADVQVQDGIVVLRETD